MTKDNAPNTQTTSRSQQLKMALKVKKKGDKTIQLLTRKLLTILLQLAVPMDTFFQRLVSQSAQQHTAFQTLIC
jgi:hypothetical protein